MACTDSSTPDCTSSGSSSVNCASAATVSSRPVIEINSLVTRSPSPPTPLPLKRGEGRSSGFLHQILDYCLNSIDIQIVNDCGNPFTPACVGEQAGDRGVVLDM